MDIETLLEKVREAKNLTVGLIKKVPEEVNDLSLIYDALDTAETRLLENNADEE